MAENPIERNPVTRYLLGMAVVFAMMLGGGAGAYLLTELSVPYGRWIGALVGAFVVFVAFAVIYRRYDLRATSSA